MQVGEGLWFGLVSGLMCVRMGGEDLELEVVFAVDVLHEAIHAGALRVGMLPAWR